MGMKVFLAVAVVSFLLATTGSDVFARMTVGGQNLGAALSDHFYWAGVQFIATILLFLPFGFLAVIGSWIEDKADRLKAIVVFGLPTLYLIYSYFEGYQAAKVAELDKHWTAATLSIGFLPFAALPIVLLAWLIGYVAIRFNRKSQTTELTDQD
jgi:hypothetical protein